MNPHHWEGRHRPTSFTGIRSLVRPFSDADAPGRRPTGVIALASPDRRSPDSGPGHPRPAPLHMGSRSRWALYRNDWHRLVGTAHPHRERGPSCSPVVSSDPRRGTSSSREYVHPRLLSALRTAQRHGHRGTVLPCYRRSVQWLGDRGGRSPGGGPPTALLTTRGGKHLAVGAFRPGVTPFSYHGVPAALDWMGNRLGRTWPGAKRAFSQVGARDS